MVTVNQLIAELEERDQEAVVKVSGDGDIIEVEVTDDGNVLISGETNGTE